MMRVNAANSTASAIALGASMVAFAAHGQSSEETAACEALRDAPNLTITHARIKPRDGETPAYCYVRGTISPAIGFHLQLPLPSAWNGRFLNWGDGGKDGDLDFADHRVAQGYAVANSNTGHDNGAEPGASFAFNNRQAEIDFGYRAVHLTVNAAKTAIRRYYDRDIEFSYHEGCSTGGRQGLMEAQRYPTDFDGIVAGAPVNHYQAHNASSIWMLQRTFANDHAGSLAYDADGDGVAESISKLESLASIVMRQCDSIDGIEDGVIEDPLQCDFDPRRDLSTKMCTDDVNGPACFTRAQVGAIADIYTGAVDSNGNLSHKGKAPGSELEWDLYLYVGDPDPLTPSVDHINYLFYEHDPGVTVADQYDPSYRPRKIGPAPEYAWWEFDIDDLANGKGAFMSAITDATDPEMRRFLIGNGGKLMVYHGWADGGPSPEATLDYYGRVVDATFAGDLEQARESTRLFMIPGMYHCRRGPGPTEWDRLQPLVDWVENGTAPDFLIGRHRTDGVIDNERRICAYPQQAVYTGPAGGEGVPANWQADNFTCR